MFNTRFLEDLDRANEPFTKYPNKIKEPVRPSLQDMTIQHIYATADASIYQTPYRDVKGKKKAFLETMQRIEDEVDGVQRSEETGQPMEMREARPREAEGRAAPPHTNTAAVRHAPNTVAIDLAQSLYEAEMKRLLHQIAEASIAEQHAHQSQLQTPLYDNIFDQTLRKMLEDIAVEELNAHNKRLKVVQSNEIKKLAKDKIVDDLALDHMLGTVAQHGRVVAEDDDAGKLLDSEIQAFLQ